MRVPVVILMSVGLLVSALGAQEPVAGLVVEANQLRNAGRPQAAIAILEPVLRGDDRGLTADERGIAWNVLGASYQDLEMWEKARRGYETAIEILRSIAAAQGPYAAAIDNLASLEDALGQEESAKRLCEKARDIYKTLGDSAGISITSTNLALIAYVQKDFKNARRSLERAVAQAQNTTALGEDSLANMYSVKTALALHDRRYDDAIAAIQQAIDCWTHAHGPAYVMLGAAYGLRAQGVAGSGDYAHALADARHGLAIVEAAVGRNSSAYWRVELIYAEVLQASGEKKQASRLKKEASRSLLDLASRQCSGCTINASGFR